MLKAEFALSYNRDLGRPNWVSWHLSDEWVGTLERVDTFRPDPRVPPDWYRVQAFDFANSGFDRGHMVPNADRDKETSIPINQATFLMTNMLAQAPDNNQGPWAALENYLRTLLPSDEIYIVAGGAGTGGTGSEGGLTMTLANGHVTVPACTWKVALVIPKGFSDISRVSCSSRTIAVIMPNTQGIRNDPWENYLTTVDAVEALTGYNLFSELPLAIQQCVEAGINGNNPPLDETPPVITITAPSALTYIVGQPVTANYTCIDAGLSHRHVQRTNRQRTGDLHVSAWCGRVHGDGVRYGREHGESERLVQRRLQHLRALRPDQGAQGRQYGAHQAAGLQLQRCKRVIAGHQCCGDWRRACSPTTRPVCWRTPAMPIPTISSGSSGRGGSTCST